MKKILASFVIAGLILAGAGCASMNRTQKGAVDRAKG
jgi:CHASE3 domain sensor protein